MKRPIKSKEIELVIKKSFHQVKSNPKCLYWVHSTEYLKEKNNTNPSQKLL